MTTTPMPRVVIDTRANGDFFIYSDPEVEVIVRNAHIPADELCRHGRYPIPEEWLRDKPIGFRGDGSDADGRAELIAEVFGASRAA